MENRESPRRTRLLASGLLVVTFVVGALAGAAADRSLKASEQESRETRRSGSDRDRGRRGYRIPSIFMDTAVFTRIGATPEQRQTIGGILARRDSSAAMLYGQIRPAIDSMIEQTRAEILAQLTTGQRAELDLIFKELRERRARRDQDRERNHDNKPKP